MATAKNATKDPTTDAGTAKMRTRTEIASGWTFRKVAHKGAPESRRVAARDRPRLRAHGSVGGGQDRRPVPPAEREGPAVDRERVVGVPHHPARRRRDAGARARRAGVRRPRHLRRGVRQRRARADRRQHVPELARRREAAPQAGRQPDPGALRVADREGQARLRQARLQAARRQRSGQGDGQHVRAQGALPLRLGLGPALRHQRHLAAGGAGGVGRGAPRRRAGVPEQAGRQGRASWASSRASSPRAPAARASRWRMPGGPTLGHADVTLKPGVNDVKLGARIDKPELWWPAGLGAAAALHAGDAADGRRRQAARRAHDAHRPADDRGRPRARQARARASPSRSTARPCS